MYLVPHGPPVYGQTQKYHLSRTPACLHGLRVVTGTVYSYGSGTKRTGERQHRGIPPQRLPGPLNATPAQRLAAAEGRVCTAGELSAELLRVTGSDDVYRWSSGNVDAALAQAPARVDLIDAPSAAMPVGVPPPSSTPRPLRWFSLVDYSRVAASDWHTPSPRWDGILQSPFVIQLPSTWHRFCRVWLAMQSVPAWSGQAFRAARVLRDVSVVDPGIDPVAAGASPPPLLLDFLAATVSLRQVCSALHSHGCAWISGIPSPTGQSLLRSLLPDTTFHVVRSESTTAFVAAHVTSSPSVWRRELSSLLAASPVVASPSVLPLRSTLVYRTRSLN